MSRHGSTRQLPAELPDLLEDLAAPRRPEYVDALFARIATAPQRPRWTFVNRWVPGPIARVRVEESSVASWQFIVIALVVLALIATAILAVGSRRKLPPPLGPAVPGAIGYVADGQIWLAGPGGADGRPIIAEGINLHPVFSPDGTKLAFERIAEPGSHANWQEWGSVIVADASGENVVLIEGDQQGLSPLSWSADSRLLVYSKMVGGADQVVVAQADGSAAQQVTRDRDASWGPVLAPNGRQIAFVRTTQAAFELRAIDIDGTNERVLSDDLLSRFDVAVWSPDSRTIVFGAGEPAAFAADLWRLDVETGDSTPFVVGTGNQLGPTWSPHGQAIAYVDEAWKDHSVIRVVSANGTLPRGISEAASWTYPVWSPDGKHVVAADQAPGGIPRLVILDAEGIEQPVQIDLPNRDVVGRVDLPAWQRLAR